MDERQFEHLFRRLTSGTGAPTEMVTRAVHDRVVANLRSLLGSRVLVRDAAELKALVSKGIRVHGPYFIREATDVPPDERKRKKPVRKPNA